MLRNLFVLQIERTQHAVSLQPIGGAASSPFISSEPIPSLPGVTDEYDPLRPNDYEDYMKKRREQRNREREEERKLEIEERERYVQLLNM